MRKCATMSDKVLYKTPISTQVALFCPCHTIVDDKTKLEQKLPRFARKVESFVVFEMFFVAFCTQDAFCKMRF